MSFCEKSAMKNSKKKGGGEVKDRLNFFLNKINFGNNRRPFKHFSPPWTKTKTKTDISGLGISPMKTIGLV